jgi:hypothetical protein
LEVKLLTPAAMAERVESAVTEGMALLPTTSLIRKHFLATIKLLSIR